MPGLDGLRAIAVTGVVAYHLQFLGQWVPGGLLPGGLLGVGVFFTLSGYLITDLLLNEWDSTGGIVLKNFWIRRARRLLPALFLLLAVVSIWVALLHPSELTSLRGFVLAAVLYIGNWWAIAHVSYFTRFGAPGPLDHLWSLAVEEQFYVIWPFLLWGGLHVIRNRRQMALIALGLAAVSSVLMWVLYQPGYDPTRVYEGTDTRAAGLLIGAALAMVWPSYRLRTNFGRSQRWTLDILGGVGLLTIVAMFLWTDQYSPWMYHGGIILLSVATAMVVGAAAHPASILGKWIGCAPLQWIGVRSYGIYLWHFPIIVLTTTAFIVPSMPVQLLDASATVAVAALSWHFMEEPIRRGALNQLWQHLRTGSWRLVPPKAWGAVTASVLLIAFAGCGLSSSPSAGAPKNDHGAPPPPVRSRLPHLLPWMSGSQPTRNSRHHRLKLRTSCQSVAYIGDSTSEGMILSDYLPNSSQQLPARLRQVGVKYEHIEISGARSIVEVLQNQQNAYQVAQSLKRSGFHGCWILALGTNDTANVYVGSPVSRQARIKEMMSVIGKDRVMWTTLKTLNQTGPYSETDMRLWNQAVEGTCKSHHNMKVFNWASVVKDSWFISDNIHYTSTGYEHRAWSTIIALAHAWPAKGKSQSSGCLVT